MLALRGGVVRNGGDVCKSWMSAVEVIREVVEDADTDLWLEVTVG